MLIVIDIPEQIKSILNDENQWSALVLAELKDIINNGRPLPDKKPTKDTDINVIYGKNADAINRGWNACLNEITGETEQIDEERQKRIDAIKAVAEAKLNEWFGETE